MASSKFFLHSTRLQPLHLGTRNTDEENGVADVACVQSCDRKTGQFVHCLQIYKEQKNFTKPPVSLRYPVSCCSLSSTTVPCRQHASVVWRNSSALGVVVACCTPGSDCMLPASCCTAAVVVEASFFGESFSIAVALTFRTLIAWQTTQSASRCVF